MSTWKSMLLAGTIAFAPLTAHAAVPKEAPAAEVIAVDVPADDYVDPSSPEGLAQTKAKMQKEMDQAIAMVEKIFGTDKLPPIAPAQLAIAQKTTGALVPTGSLEKMMDNLYGKLFRGLMGELGGMSDIMLSYKTGVEADKISALDDVTKEKIADIFDPNRKAREEQIMTNVKPLISEVLRDLEVPMREGMANAFARKFSADQLNQMNAFFATPAGSAYASEWMALQADPEIILAIIKSVPPMANKWIDRAPELEGKFKDLPKERQMADLSDADLTKLAGLMKVDVQTLKDQRDLYKSVDDAAMEATDAAAYDDTAVAAAADAAAAAGDAVDAAGDFDAGYDRSNWSDADREKVEALETAVSEATSAAYEAEAAAAANARKKLGLPDTAE
ncbi:DUF2059 domain-containing protein [Sphingopyxis sp. OPL5]|uniref:DUF2059 domain-containing protein n=1 Tax=Sphingopyxis sp. OPL5 TaxID=2486273 RepID=UPI00223AA829|nr:DUF2059 domain-containing protein [Sphingopyxis sp. OPL5]